MQISAQNSLTWLQTTPAAVAAADQIGSSYGQVSPGDDASGADAGAAVISGLQSPAQMFSSASLSTLVSSQTDNGVGGDPATSSAPIGHHHHHHSGGAPPQETTQAAVASSGQTADTSSASANSTDASVQADLSELLMTV